jgi:hypothetical protein
VFWFLCPLEWAVVETIVLENHLHADLRGFYARSNGLWWKH